MALGAVAGSALATAWVGPLAAGFTTTAVFFGWHPFGSTSAVGAGIAAGMIVWAIATLGLSPFVGYPETRPGSWDRAESRLDELAAMLTGLRPGGCAGSSTAIKEAEADIDFLRDPVFRRPGARWATHMGYTTMWGRINRIEGALILCTDTAGLWQTVQRVRLQLDGATAELSGRLKAIVDDIARFLAQPQAATAWQAPQPAPPAPPAPAAPAAQPTQSAQPAQPTDLGLPPVMSEEDARGRLRQVSEALGSFRNEKYAGLIRLRNLTLAALCLTELSAFVLLSLAVAYPAKREDVATGILLFLVAGVTGFLARLLTLSSLKAEIEDYGLNAARLLIVPVVSGLAGLGGVVLTAMLFSTGFSSLVSVSAARVNPPGSLPSLSDMFNLTTYPAALLFAIVFGYAPTLLQARLDPLVQSYKQAIKSTEPASDNAAAGSGG